jgi:PKD repeat protein
MKKFIVYVLCAGLLISGFGLIGISGKDSKNESAPLFSPDDFPDISAYYYTIASHSLLGDLDSETNLWTVLPDERKEDYPIGTVIWQYTISGGSDNSAKAIVAIPDINSDGVDDVVICSEENNIRCFSGGELGSGDVLWTHNIYSGNIYSQHGLSITQDINNDGYNEVVVGTTGGDRSIECLSGDDGNTIWTHDTHEYGGGGWVYQVDCRYDYNNDDVIDVLAVCGDDSSDTGPKRVYCLNGLTGLALWERPLGGPGFAVIGIEDFTGDGVPDVLAGCSDESESDGFAKGINGATGVQLWSFPVTGSSVWGVEQLDDVNGDGVKDVAIGDFSGHVYGLNAETGSELFSLTVGSVIITRLERLDDVNDDGYGDFIACHSTTHTTQAIDGFDGQIIWSHDVADQPWNVAPCSDITGDGIGDVFVGTLYQTNYVYFLNGVDGSELTSPIAYNQAVDSIASIPDIVDDGSMEMVAGGRDGKVTVYSGGEVTQQQVSLIANFSATPLSGEAPLNVQFTDLSIAENTTITSWQWDFDDDGSIDSLVQNPSWYYLEPGNYTVSLTVSDGDITDTETKEHYITVVPPAGHSNLEIGNITGGLLKISAEIKNTGDTDATSVNWSIKVSNGFVLLGKTASGTIVSLPSGGMEIVTDRPVIGLGNIGITIEVQEPDGPLVTKTVYGKLFLFLVYDI